MMPITANWRSAALISLIAVVMLGTSGVAGAGSTGRDSTTAGIAAESALPTWRAAVQKLALRQDPSSREAYQTLMSYPDGPYMLSFRDVDAVDLATANAAWPSRLGAQSRRYVLRELHMWIVVDVYSEGTARATMDTYLLDSNFDSVEASFAPFTVIVSQPGDGNGFEFSTSTGDRRRTTDANLSCAGECALVSAAAAIASGYACAVFLPLTGIPATAPVGVLGFLVCASITTGTAYAAADVCNRKNAACNPEARNGTLFQLREGTRCEAFNSCGYNAVAAGAANLQAVDGFYYYFIKDWGDYALDYIHSGFRAQSRVYTDFATGVQSWSATGQLTGNSSFRGYRCSNTLIVDATALWSDGRRSGDSRQNAKPTGGYQGDCL